MTGGRTVARWWPGGVPLALLGLMLLAGLFAMHGMTATPSPMHASSPAPLAHASPAATAHEPAGRSMTAGDHLTGPPPMAEVGGTQGPAGHTMGGHPGAVCFALLIVGLLLATIAGRSIVPPSFRAGIGGPRPRDPPRTRPPSVYQLSVLRL